MKCSSTAAISCCLCSCCHHWLTLFAVVANAINVYAEHSIVTATVTATTRTILPLPLASSTTATTRATATTSTSAYYFNMPSTSTIQSTQSGRERQEQHEVQQQQFIVNSPIWLQQQIAHLNAQLDYLDNGTSNVNVNVHFNAHTPQQELLQQQQQHQQPEHFKQHLTQQQHKSIVTLSEHGMLATTKANHSQQLLLPLHQQAQQQHAGKWQQRQRRQAAAETELNDKCRLFTEGEPGKNELYSPDYPNDYPRNINCTRVITAPKGQIIRLDFRNSFHIEDKEECKFDFLEVRDGQYGFSNLIGKYCGTDFPPEITSKERYLWLHFHSDESIEYSGFTAVYEFIDRSREAPSTDLNCTIEKDGYEGFINSTDVPQEIRETVQKNKIPLDCMWRIQVQDKWKIQVKFLDFKLSKPNDCETNFLDIFPEQTLMPYRVKNFCGSAGEGITSDTNILHMRFYAEQIAINSTFAILYTAFRDRGSTACTEDEYDCEDATCISNKLKCNGRDNCKFRWDEEGCEKNKTGQSEHVTIIIIVFGLILGGMVITFLINCVRKIMRDQKIIREHIRQSRESKLDEMGRNSKSRQSQITTHGVLASNRHKYSDTSLQIMENVPNRLYREQNMPISRQASRAELKEQDHSILRHRQDMIVQTSLSNNDDGSSSTTTAAHDATALADVTQRSCDMGCQTRESLFAPVLMKQKSIGSMGRHEPIEFVGDVMPHEHGAATRLSTFAYDPQQQQQQRHTPQPTQHLHHSTHLAQPTGHADICHHHFQHQQHALHPQQQHQQQPMQFRQKTEQPKALSKTTINIKPSQPGAAGPTSVMDNKKKQQKSEESKVFIDIRNSAPDVIIMTSH